MTTSKHLSKIWAYLKPGNLKMLKNKDLIVVNKKDPLLNLEYLVNKKCSKFSFLYNEDVNSFYSEVYSLSRLNSANVVLVDEHASGLVRTSFYSTLKTSSENLSQLFKGKVGLDYTNKKCILAKGCEFPLKK
ncbi:MAG: hypothetical protein AABX44_00055 [Nanoarchaeota archaeon]